MTLHDRDAEDVTASAGRDSSVTNRCKLEATRLYVPQERRKGVTKTPSQGIPVPARGALADSLRRTSCFAALCTPPGSSIRVCGHGTLLDTLLASGHPSLSGFSPSVRVVRASRALISEPEDKLPVTGPGNSSCYNNQSCKNKTTLQNKPFRP